MKEVIVYDLMCVILIQDCPHNTKLKHLAKVRSWLRVKIYFFITFLYLLKDMERLWSWLKETNVVCQQEMECEQQSPMSKSEMMDMLRFDCKS